MASESCFTLVCLRRLEEEIALHAEVEDLSLSHDRRLLVARDAGGRCFCYSCDNARPAFLLPQAVASEVEQNAWLQLPAEKSVRLDRHALSEYPGIPCLVALQRGNAALTLCRFFRIESPAAQVVECSARLADSPAALDRGELLLKWEVNELPESLKPNEVWRSAVPLAALLALLPEAADALRLDGTGGCEGGEEDGGEASEAGGQREEGAQGAGPPAGGEEAAAADPYAHVRIRLCVARPDALMVFFDDLVALLVTFGWKGVRAHQCFFLQRPAWGPDPPEHARVQFCDIIARQDWIFAVTPPPMVRLLIWHGTGVAFHAISLSEYLDEEVHFVSLVVALDLLGVALCDNHHNVWIMSLDRYFDSSLKGLDWELLKERQRCARGVGTLGQMGKDYQDLSVYPQAFGLSLHGDRKSKAAGAPRRQSISTSIMDCLVEGVPTYGIPIPGGAFGIGDQLFGGGGGAPDPLAPDAHTLEGEPGGASAPSGLGGPDMAATRCIPFAWHERIYQTQEWLELDRPWTIARGERLDLALEEAGGGGYGLPLQAARQLNGFSIPAQNKLGDDDLHYSLCAALQKHARRQFQSRLPPWLSKTELRQRAHQFNPPMLGTVGEGEESDTTSELAQESGGDLPPPLPGEAAGGAGGGRATRGPHSNSSGSREATPLATLRQELSATIEGPGGQPRPRPRRRRQVRIGRLRLYMTASHVFCEIWEESGINGPAPDCPWGVCVVSRPTGARRGGLSNCPQVDHLTGSLLETFPESQLPGHQVVLFRSRRKWRSLLTQNHIWYMLSEGGGLYALVLHQSPVRIISNLLIFESRAKASRLCALNGWDAKQLPVLTLYLGLRFRQLEEIRQSLGILKPDQEMEACQMVMDFIRAGYSCAALPLPFSPSPSAPLLAAAPRPAAGREGSSFTGGARAEAPQAVHPAAAAAHLPADRSFVSRLLEIAMQFLTKLIQTRVAQIQDCEGACRAITYLQPKHAASEPSRYAAMVHELSQLTVHMQSLRTLQQQLISSFGDDKSFDSGILICCPAQRLETEQEKAASLKTGLKTLDDAVALATKLQAAGGGVALKDRLAMMAPIRSQESTEAIVRGALISGRVSSALNWFHELSLEDGSSASGRVFEDFRVTAGRLAYQLVCNQQLDFLFVAMHMLRNVGESVNRFFKAVAFHTSKRLVRRRLLRHVDHMHRLTKDEQSLISLVNLLEQLYTNPCYTTELNRMTTRLTTGQYPQRASGPSQPPFFTWPAGGRSMFLVGLSCDGALGGHVGVDTAESAESSFEQQTSLRELPMSQRMPLEMYDMWAGYQTPVMAAMLEMPGEARRAWGSLPCGDIDDLDAHAVLGLSNFHKGSNLEKDLDNSTDNAGAHEGGEGDGDMVSQAAHTAAWTTCRRCRLEGPKDELDFEPTQHGADGGMTGAFLEALGLGELSPKLHTMGYLHVTLSWMKCWSWDTRARIIMEKTHFHTRMAESLPFLQPPPEVGAPDQAWRRCWLDFLVAHQDWRGLAAWVRRLPLRLGERVDGHGRSSVDLSHLEERGLPYCTSYTKEILLQELGRRGLFCRGDAHSFPALLRRLAQCGRLFGDGAQAGGDAVQAVADVPEADTALPEEGALPLDRLLPSKTVCPFHRFFIHFCIDHDLPTVMLLYLQKYELATTMDGLKALELRHAERSWASLLLVGRLGNAHLFAASLQHAATVFAGADSKTGEGHDKTAVTWSDAERVRLMPLNCLAERRPVAFLATLMCAPVASAMDAAKAPVGAPWFVDLALFKKVVKDYPALQEAFFPNGTGGGGAAAAPPHRVQTVPAPDPGLRMSLVESVAEANRRRWSQADATPPLDAAAAAGPPAAGGTAAPAPGAAKEKAQQTLDDMTTSKEDVSLSTLLSDVAAFDVHKALRPLPIFKSDLLGVTAEAAMDSSLSALVAPEEKFQDELEEGYFLAQGRAMMAFHVLMTRCIRRMEQPGEPKFPLVLSSEDAKRLHKVAKSVALHNLLNEGVVSSSVCLLELCSLETEMLRVDVQAAKRIYEHQVQQGHGAGHEDSDRLRAAAASVIELFLSFPDVRDVPSRAAEAAISSGHLLTALRMLEESTWALDPHPSAPSVSSLQALAYDSPWHLVALFCRVHSLPRSLTLLHELARNNDWVMFLHESDLQQCPADTVLDIVNGYFTDVPLQSHLRILAHSIAAQERDPAAHSSAQVELGGEEPQVAAGRIRGEVDARQVVDAIGFLERCRTKAGGAPHRGTGWGLLHHALSNRTARLAVAASAFSDVSALQCMAVWLSVNTERSYGGASAEVVAASATPAQSSPGEVAAQIAALCRKSHAFSLVLRALKIFDPENPLVDFVKFHRAFVQCRFKSCSEHLRRFVQRRSEESVDGAASRGPYCLELVPYVTQLSEDMVQYLLDGFPRARMMLLSALDQAGFSPHYSHLFRSFRLIQQTGLDVDFRMPPGELLQMLISRKMFAQAREWAKSSEIVGDTIVFEEVTGMIVEFRQGVWWNVLDERLHLWHKCYDAFLRQSYPPVGAALFFLDITSKLEPDLFAREQLMLLCIALELLGSGAGEEPASTAAAASPAQPPAPSQAQAQAPQAPGREHLSRIKLSMLLILTGTNKDLTAELDFSPLDLSYNVLRTLVHRVPESVAALPLYHAEASTGAGALQAWGGGAGGPPAAGGTANPASSPMFATAEQRGPRSELLPYLDTAISSLINCDQLGWAKQLAQGFGFESADLRLAQAVETIASGRFQEALADLAAAPHALPFDAGAVAAAAEAGDVEKLLQSLSAQCSPRITLFCRRCMVCFAVSRTIGLGYAEVSQTDVGELLDRLLRPQPLGSGIALCRSLLSCDPRPRNKGALAEVLANRFVRSTVEPGTREWPEEDLDEFVSLLGSSQEKLGDAALSRLPNFRRGTRSVCPGGEPEAASQPPADEEIELPFECEVEVVIMAYHAYVQGCCERSIGELLRFLRQRVEVYVEHGRLPLLVRLLVAIPEYHAMEYMFGHLMRHNRLDLLLALGRSGKSGTGGAPSTALAIALVRYLQDHFPRNLEILVQVHRCFGMVSQLASLLEHKAHKVAQALGRKWEHICAQAGEEQLLLCLSLFLQCSRFFLRAKRYQQHLVANDLAALICVQLKAVQIHLAASLQEQQNAAQRPICGRDPSGFGPAMLLLPPATPGANAGPGGLGAGVAGAAGGLLGASAAPGEGGGPDAGAEAAGGSFLGEDFLPYLEDEPGRIEATALAGASPGAALAVGVGGAATVPSILQSLSGDAGPAASLRPILGDDFPGAAAPSPAAAPPPLGPAGDPFVVINLEAVEVEVFAEYHQDFVVAYQVVCAYRHTCDAGLFRVWPRALYRQVVLLGNFAYLQLFMRHLPLTKEYLEASVRLYNNEACPEQFPQRARRMKHLLREGVPNLETRYQLARQLGAEFADVQNETASLVYMA